MKRAVAVFTLFAVLLSSGPAFAVDYSVRKVEFDQSDEPPNAFERYGIKVGTKFDYGMLNLVIGWTEIMTEPARHARKDGSKWQQGLSIVGRSFLGIGLAIVDTVGGAVNVLTSPVPAMIPLPRGGVDRQYLTTGKSEN